ncbi:MAG: CopG family transcriptional regulator [Chthoniobacteraceae bacterium]
MKPLSVKVPDSLIAEIASAAESRKVPKSEIVRERLAGKPAVAQSHKTSLWSRMEDLVIHADSLPADLSSNKARMKGYRKKRSH